MSSIRARLLDSYVMPSVRQQVLDAFTSLESRTGLRVFRLRDIVVEVRNHNRALSEQTVRTYVTSVMCANAPIHHANHTDDLVRVERGMYRRTSVDSASETEFSPSAKPADPTQPVEDVEVGIIHDGDWYWEGHVQASVVSGLATSGWRVLAVADTQSRAAGTDIVAEKDGRRLHVEVKGYPSNTYARGGKQGEPKPHHPASQARQFFAGALMKAAMLRGDHPEDAIAIALPAFETYSSLVRRVSSTLASSFIEVIWVEESGDVRFDSIEPERG